MLSDKRISRFIITGGLAAVACIGIGSLWDTMIHITMGHTLLAPAHLFIIASAFFFTLSGFTALFLMRRADQIARAHLKTVMRGGLTLFIALVVVDEIWHLLFGLDTSGWSPPHLLFWAGALMELFGLLMLERWLSTKNDTSTRQKKIRVSQLLLAASVLTILLFLFLEFDVPHSRIERFIPGYTYPVVGTTIFVTGILVVGRAVRGSFLVTAAAIIAWLFFWLTGSTIEFLSSFSFVEPPFPIFIPALIYGVWSKFVWKDKTPIRLSQFIYAAIPLSLVCYWAMVGWAANVTQLPQQISGLPSDWILWCATFIVPILLIAAFIAWRIAKHITYLEELSQESIQLPNPELARIT